MTIFYIVLLTLSVIHFIYESIILPSIRLELRFKYFALRDRLRHIKLIQNPMLDGKAFIYLQENLNNCITFLYSVDFKSFIDAQRVMERDKKLRKRIEKRVESIEGCGDKEVLKIWKDAKILFTITLLANNGIWFIYVLPFLIMVILVFFCFSKIKNFIVLLLSIPENEVGKIIPSEDLKLATY